MNICRMAMSQANLTFINNNKFNNNINLLLKQWNKRETAKQSAGKIKHLVCLHKHTHTHTHTHTQTQMYFP